MESSIIGSIAGRSARGGPEAILKIWDSFTRYVRPFEALSGVPGYCVEPTGIRVVIT
jgi:hypothetical protein